MPTAAQPYFFEANWPQLFDAINNPNKYPNGIPIDSRYPEDLRKIIWLLMHTFCSNINEAAYVFTKDVIPNGGDSILFATAGQWTCCKLDTKLNRYIWFKNKNSLTRGEARAITAPPDSIHPYHDKDAWKSGTYSANHIVQRFTTGRAYQASIAIDEAHADIAPEDHPAGWTNIGPLWIFETSDWVCRPSYKYYHDWDTCSPMQNINSYFTVLDQTPQDSIEMGPLQAKNYLPIQTDPVAQFPAIIFQDDSKTRYDYKSKVAINQLPQSLFTKPDTLKANFTFDLPRYWQQHEGEGDSYTAIVMKNDPAFADRVECGMWVGDQYCNFMLESWPSYPPGSNTNIIGNTPIEDNPTFNPAINGALQNHIMVIASYSGFEFVPDNTFITNYRIVFTDCPEDVTQYNAWQSYVPGAYAFWGENESAFEYALKFVGSYDWAFQMDNIYYPSSIMKYIQDCILNHGANESTIKALCDVANCVGTWRRNFAHSLGRPCKWMRSNEMGEPPRRDAWNPDRNSVPAMDEGDKRWFGARSTAYPAINQFDTEFATIADKTQDHILSVSGDITANLKIGYMLHFCNSQTDPIVANNVELPEAYVLNCEYDGSNTLIELDRKITTNYSKIGWNPDISERHDPDRYIMDGTTVKFYWTAKKLPWLLYNCWQLLQGLMYIRVDADIETKGYADSFSVYYPPLDDDLNTEYHDFDAPFNKGFAKLRKRWTLNVNAAKWHNNDYGWGGNVANETILTSVEGLITGNPDGNNEDVNFMWWECDSYGPPTIQAMAFRIKWPTVLLPTGEAYNFPFDVAVRLSVDDIKDNHEHIVGGYYIQDSQSCGEISNHIIPWEQDIGTHYYYMKGLRSGEWHILKPDVFQPAYASKTIQYTDEHNWQIAGGGVANLPIGIDLQNGSVEVILNWERIPEIVMARTNVPHIDVPVDDVVDTRPPLPNPPVFHFAAPYAYFKYTPPYGTGKTPENPQEWQPLTAYNQGAYVLDPSRQIYSETDGNFSYFYELYQAKQNIDNTHTNVPSVDGANWELVPGSFALMAAVESCLCIDYQKSDPVEYRLVNRNHDNLTSDWTQQRFVEVKLRDVSISSASITSLTYNMVTNRVKIYSSLPVSVGDKVMIRGYLNFSGTYEVVAIDSGWFEVSCDWIITYGAPVGVIAINLSTIYKDSNWTADAFANELFAIQSKDSASPQNNLSKLSEYLNPAEPEKWPVDLLLS